MIRRSGISQCAVAILLSLLASDVSAQPQALIGAWRYEQNTDETDLDSRLTLAADGVAHVELAGVFSQGFLSGSADEDVQQLADLFPEGVQIQIIADGTWGATDDSLTLSFPDPDLLINGDTFEVFLITIATSLAQAVIQQLDLPVDQEPTVIATFVDLLAEDLSQQDVTDQAFASGGEATAYRLEQGVLILVDADGIEAHWHNLISSLVKFTSWGHLKR